MNLNLLFYNIAYYFVTILLFQQARQDPSSSLSVAFLVLAFWIVAGIALFVLYKRRVIKVETWVDRIAMFTATPVLTFVVIQLFANSGGGGGSEWFFDRNNYRYKVVTTNYRGSTQPKSIEYYKSSQPVKADTSFFAIDDWIKDSTWVQFSQQGDTTKVTRYVSGRKID